MKKMPKKSKTRPNDCSLITIIVCPYCEEELYGLVLKSKVIKCGSCGNQFLLTKEGSEVETIN